MANEALSRTGNDATNLPIRLTQLIGREREQAELAERLTLSRLTTLAGPGGVGKTRLAVELGWRVLREFRDGVWLIDLAPLHSQDAIINTLAATLGVSVTKIETAMNAIIAALGKAERLLIFDNCEHLVEQAAPLLQTLLDRTPNVSILATSQRELRLKGELVYALDPLEVPPPGAAVLGEFAAARLFIARAFAADRQFKVDVTNRAVVAEICRQLDGLPLALEMAAGRLRLLGVQGLSRGLHERLKMLKDSNSRHGSLQGMLEWSHSLLEPLDQQIFRRLAAFPSGFSLEAAIDVAGWDMERWTVIDALGRLLDRSLVTVEQREPPRYRLLETLRLYAKRKLREAGEEDQAAERHAQHFIKVLEQAERDWENTPEPDWIARHQPELGHLRGALDWALAMTERRPVAVALAASGLALFYLLSQYAEAQKYLDRILPILDTDPPEAASRLLEWASRIYLGISDPKALPLAERSAVLCRALDDRRGLANALITIAQRRLWQGRNDEGKNLLQEAQSLLAGGDLKQSQLRLNSIFSNLLYFENDIPNALQQKREALELVKRTNSERRETGMLGDLGLFEYVAGNFDQAIEHTKSALDRSYSHSGHTRTGPLLCQLADILISKEDFSQARSRLTEGLAFLIEHRNYPARACLQGWAALAGAEGFLAEAAQLSGFSDAELGRLEEAIDPSERGNYDRLMAILQADLSATERDTLKAKGAQWSETEAIAFVTSRLLPAQVFSDQAVE